MSTLRTVAEADGRQVGVRTREDIIEALREYAARYGDDFPQAAFSPSQAKRNGRPELVERYYAHRLNGEPWPSLNGIKGVFETWNAARAAAGFKPNSTAGPAGRRRPPGSATPILNVRERVLYLKPEKVKELEREVASLRARLAGAADRNRRLVDELERSRAAKRSRKIVRDLGPVRDRVRVETRVKTVTKTVKVKDERAVERLRMKLADADARARAAEDQARAAVRDRARAENEAENLRAERAALAAESRSVLSERDRVSDRLAAAESRAERLAVEVAEAREQAMGATEAAVASDLVEAAERRAQAAEVRAARAERELAEQAAAVTGELRKLTPAELAEMRRRGPAGPAVLAAALKKLARARARNEAGLLDAALAEIARAAMTWRDRL